MESGDKLLAGIESNKLFLKKHLSRKRAMKISYGISTLVYLIIMTVLIVLTAQAYNLYDIKDLITNDGGIQGFTNTSLETIKNELGVDVDNKILLLSFTVTFAVFFILSLTFYLSLSKMNYTATPKTWLGTSIILLPLVIPFIVCIIVFVKYTKDKNWKESRKNVKQTIQPVLSSVIKEFEDDVLQKEVSVKRTANEYPGFENIYESIKTDKVKKEEKKLLKTEEKVKKLSRKEKKALKKLEKEEHKKETVKVDESQITDEVESESKEQTTSTETPSET